MGTVSSEWISCPSRRASRNWFDLGQNISHYHINSIERKLLQFSSESGPDYLQFFFHVRGQYWPILLTM